MCRKTVSRKMLWMVATGVALSAACPLRAQVVDRNDPQAPVQAQPPRPPAAVAGPEAQPIPEKDPSPEPRGAAPPLDAQQGLQDRPEQVQDRAEQVNPERVNPERVNPEQVNPEPDDQDPLVEASRQWLREQLAAGITSRRLLAAMNERVDAMSPERLARAVAVQQRKLARQQQQAQQAQFQRQRADAFWEELRMQAARESAFQSGFRRGYRYGHWDSYAPGYGTIGYAPVVTWLPTGTHFSTGGIVSSGGRFVRLHSTPFFSQVGPVTPFHVVVQRERRQEKPKLEVWHDGLRTRYGIRPDR